MHLYRTPGSGEALPTAVEVGIWEAYLLRNRNRAGKTLCTYSLDNGPLRESSGGEFVFRFTGYDWQRAIRPMLEADNIPYNLLRELRTDLQQQLLKKKIFVVEDDPDSLYTLTTVLENAGYQVRVSARGQTVMDGNYSSVDLFILDNHMPDINGLEICRYLRNQFDTRDVPVIMISAYPRKDNEALMAGANDYLEKPFEMHYLLNLVSRFTRQAGSNVKSGPREPLPHQNA